jgi:hypothetical protein
LPLFLTFAAIVASWSSHPTLRFEPPWVNYAAFIVLAAAIPLSLLWLARAARGLSRWLVVLLAAAVAVPVGFVSQFAFSDLTRIRATGIDPSFEPVHELRSRRWLYRLYRSNGGATTAYGLVLRKELPIFPGVKWVFPVTDFYPAYEGSFEVIAPGVVRLWVAPYGPSDSVQSYDFEI